MKMIQNLSDIDFSIGNIRTVYYVESSKPWLRTSTLSLYRTNNIYKIMFLKKGSMNSTIGSAHYKHPSNSMTFMMESSLEYVRESEDLPTECYGFIFRTNEPIPNIFDTSCLLLTLPKNPGYILKIFSKATQIFEEKPPFWNITLKKLLFELINEFLSSYHETKQLPQIPDYLRASVEFIRENACFCPIVLRDLAEEHGISVDRFRRNFEHYYGTTPKKYINTIKLERAVSLLLSTEKTVVEIAELSGFNNLANFNTLFRNEYGLTPIKFREKNNPIIL